MMMETVKRQVRLFKMVWDGWEEFLPMPHLFTIYLYIYIYIYTYMYIHIHTYIHTHISFRFSCPCLFSTRKLGFPYFPVYIPARNLNRALRIGTLLMRQKGRPARRTKQNSGFPAHRPFGPREA